MLLKSLKELKLVSITKKDTLFLLICLFLYIIFVALTYQKWGSPVVDCGRDVYVAERLLNSDNLYTDIYYIYGPLAPYTLASLFFIFGANLNIAYWLGIILASVTLLLLYLIAKYLLNSNYALLAIILSIFAICFNGTIFNYIYPYTYSALIGCFLTVLLAYFYCLQIKKDSNLYLGFIGSITGLLCLTKIEFGFAAIAAIIGYFLISKTQKLTFTKQSILIILITLIPLILIPLLTGLIIISQSGIEEIVKYIEYSSISLNSESSKFFASNILGHNSFINLYTDNLNALFTGFILLVILNVFVFAITSSKYKSYTYQLAGIFSIIIIVIALISFTDLSGAIFSIRHLIIPITPFIITALIIIYCAKVFIKKKKLSYKEQAILILSILTLCASLRIFFYFYFSFYSTFYSLLAIIIMFYAAKRSAPYLIKMHKANKNIRYFINSSFIMIFIFCCFNASLINYVFKNHPIVTSKGTIKTEESMANSFNTLISILKQDKNKNKAFMMAPESTIIYFLADKKSPTKFYDYLPLRLTTPEQEHYLIESLKSNNVETIAISNRSTSEYGKDHWGTDYNQRVFEWVKANYNLCGIIGSQKPDSGLARFPEFKIAIFKKQCKNN